MLPDSWSLLLYAECSQEVIATLQQKLLDRFVLVDKESSVEDALYAMDSILILTPESGFVGDVKNAVVECAGITLNNHVERFTATHIAGVVQRVAALGVEDLAADRETRTWKFFCDGLL